MRKIGTNSCSQAWQKKLLWIKQKSLEELLETFPVDDPKAERFFAELRLSPRFTVSLQRTRLQNYDRNSSYSELLPPPNLGEAEESAYKPDLAWELKILPARLFVRHPNGISERQHSEKLHNNFNFTLDTMLTSKYFIEIREFL